MIKDLFALVDHAGNCAQFLNAAVAFAEAHGAYPEVGVLTSPPVAATELAPFLEGYVPDTVVAQNAARRVEEVRQLLARARCPVEVISYNGDVLWLAGDFRRV